MAWFECNPPKIKKLRKFREFRVALQWSINEALGFLCSFWGEVAELNESGEISDWTPEYLAELTDLGKIDPRRVWEALVTTEWIDAKDNGRALVRDWIEIAGSYLVRKYHSSDKQKLIQIWGLHGRIYGREQRTEKEQKGSGKEDAESGPDPQGSKKEVDSLPEGNGAERGVSLSTPLPLTPKRSGRLINPSGSGLTSPGVETHPEISVLIRLFREMQRERIGEPAAKFNYGAAGHGFKKLILNGFKSGDIAARFGAWFASDKRFIVERAFCIEDFFSYFNTLKDGPISTQVGSNGKESFYDGAATVR